MGKLIDVDDFFMHMTSLYKIAGWDEREVHFSLADLKANLDGEEPVEAIPIEWLENEIDILNMHHHDTYWIRYLIDLRKWRTTNDKTTMERT